MRERHVYDAPIKAYSYNGKRCYYRYKDEDFSIFKNELSSEELTNLRSTLEMSGRYRGIPNYAWLEEVVSNLEYRFGVRPNSENVVSFEQNEKLKGLEYLSDIIDATVNHQSLEIRYVTFKGKEILSVVHPYHVKQFNNRWFLFGLEEGENDVYISNKALDRIRKISTSDKEFIKNTFIDFLLFLMI
ncbi:helix-turn-helix transcriptional regulator [Proteiniphilum sp. UBA5384]|uniref:helix-turn-helix transcriptional regulator n=1 Tax=Proteiniphilum sp. UBA5384 TaxID=1947279 RepID=UPI0025FC857A|nr:WYL domain-containing protein [Proteiniphilum sp. UBA5384]